MLIEMRNSTASDDTPASAPDAHVAHGGELDTAPGKHRCATTILSGATGVMEVAHEGGFGPVQPVIAYDAVGEAFSIANDTAFPLSSNYSIPLSRRRVAMRLSGGRAYD